MLAPYLLRHVDVGLLLDDGADLAAAHELKQRVGEGKVHQSVVLQSLGQEDAEEPEQLGDSAAQIRILGQRSGEES